jgi:hypothetical protein
VRTILFHRKYRRFHGGHLKVWNYFNHVLAVPGFDARVLFDANSSWDQSNPWSHARESVIDSLEFVEPDALFIAGRDWQRLDEFGLLDKGLPILNLIQHVRHAEEWSIQSRYLGRRAIRICVSDEVANAVSAQGSVGPVVVIPNGVDVEIVDQPNPSSRPTDLLIAGMKQPVLAGQLAEQLEIPGRSVEVLTQHLPREAFLEAMQRARVTLFLPNSEEGFYLPALEGMGLGTIVVCPDCIGNRSFCVPDVTAYRPEFHIDALIEATASALALTQEDAVPLIARGREMARRHSLESERMAFTQVLVGLDDLWATD